MKKYIINLYESPKKSKVLYHDPSRTEINLEGWGFVREALPEDMARLSEKQKAQLRKNGFVIIKSIRVKITEEKIRIMKKSIKFLAIFVTTLFIMPQAVAQYQVSYKNETGEWITGVFGVGNQNFRHPSIAGIGGDTIYCRIDSSGFVIHPDFWVINDGSSPTGDTIYNQDTISLVLPSDPSAIHFNYSIEADSGDIYFYNTYATGMVWPKVVPLPPSLSFDSINVTIEFNLNDTVPFVCSHVINCSPSVVYWYKDSQMIDSVSGSYFSPQTPGNYWAQAMVEYEHSDSASSPLTYYQYRMSKPSDTIFVNPIIYPVNCIQSVGTTIQNSSSDSTADGAVYLTINGGTPPYSFLWNNSSTQQNLVNVLLDYYSVQISSSDTACPVYYLCANVTTLDDTSTVFPDTIYTSVIDTCLGFSVVNYYVSDIITVGDTSTIIWVFVGANDVAIIASAYYQIAAGEHIAGITLCCTKGTDTFYYTVFIDTPETTEIGENSDCLDFIIYPNPATDCIYFSQNIDFTLLSVSGKEILRGRGNHAEVGVLEPGIYLLNVVSDNGVKFLRFVKE